MRRFIAGIVTVGLCAVAQGATTYNFSRITSNATTNVESQLTMTVDSAGSGLVSFLFQNTGATASFIQAVYFDDASTPLFTGISSIVNGSGVNMSAGGNPANLPSAMNAGPAFVSSFNATARNPSPTNGVNLGEQVEIILALGGTFTLADVNDALQDSSLRAGLHVQGIPNGSGTTSDAFVNSPDGPVVPLPTGAGLGFVGLLGLGARRSRR